MNTALGPQLATLLMIVASSMLGCSRNGEGPARPRDGSAPEGSELREGRYFMLPGAPDPLACTSDDDCQTDTVVGVDGCCVLSPMPRPQTRAWHRWLGERRMSEACRPAECETMLPSPPPACSTEAACVDGRCQYATPCPGAG